MADRLERFASLLGRVAMNVWDDMPRDVQEALFETAMKDQIADREDWPVSFTTFTPEPYIHRGAVLKETSRPERLFIGA
jgi:hypothetical protein